MRFHIFLLAAVASAFAAPQSDSAQNEADIAQLKEIVQRFKDRAPRATPPPAAGGGGGGIANTLSDVTTLLSGLSDSLTGICNLRQDITGLLGQLSNLGQ